MSQESTPVPDDSGILLEIHFPPGPFCATILPAPHFSKESERTHVHIHSGTRRILRYLLVGLRRLRLGALRRCLSSTRHRLSPRPLRLWSPPAPHCPSPS